MSNVEREISTKMKNRDGRMAEPVESNCPLFFDALRLWIGAHGCRIVISTSGLFGLL
jgi:hypothetical protein